MRLVITVYEDIVHGDARRRIHACFTLVMWFVMGAYVTSTILFYIAPDHNIVASVVGGTVVAAAASLLKTV
jgi:hypothetical protein